MQDEIKEDAGFNNQDTKQCAFYPSFQGRTMKHETRLNNQEYLQLQEEKSVHSKCTLHVHSTETICASNQIPSSVKEDEAEPTARVGNQRGTWNDF
jgi:hypothetical protein